MEHGINRNRYRNSHGSPSGQSGRFSGVTLVRGMLVAPFLRINNISADIVRHHLNRGERMEHDMLGLLVRFTLKPGHEDAFDQLVTETLTGIRDAEPGTLIYACHHVRDAPSERMFYEVYRDAEAFKAHESGPHVVRFLAERKQHVTHFEVDFLALDDAVGIFQDGA